MNTLGEYLYDLRKKSNRTIKDITDNLNITPQYLNDIENNKRVPSSSLIKKIIIEYRIDKNKTSILYDLASSSYKEEKVPADIAEFIIKNKNAKKEIRKLMNDFNS